MGSSQSGMRVQTDKHSFYPGELVSGSMNLHITSAVPECTLYLIFSGKEKTHWSSRSGRRNRPRIHHNGYRHITRFLTPIYNWPQGLRTGDHQLTFSISLPSPLPGSFYFSRSHTSGFIRYKIKGKLVSFGNKKLKTESPIIIKPPVPMITNDLVCDIRTRIKTCCFSQGSSYLKVFFRKNCYSPDEVMQVLVEVDNSLCKLRVKSVQVSLFRNIALKDKKGMTKTRRDSIITANGAGVAKGGTLLEDRTLAIDLNLPKVKKMIETTYTAESCFIQCSYFLQVSAKMSHCCCPNIPTVAIPVTIIPDNFEEPPSLPIPDGWNPELISLPHLEYSSDYENLPSAPPMD